MVGLIGNTMKRTERESCLAQIQQLVKTKYYDPHFGGKDWAAVVEQHRAAVLNSDSLDEFEAAANNMLKELGSGALGLLRSTSRISSRNAIAASFRALETSSDGNRGFSKTCHRVAPRIALVSSPATHCFESARMRSFRRRSQRSQWARTWRLLSGPAMSRRLKTITISTPKAKHRDNPAAEPRAVVGSVQDGIGIMKVSRFPGKLGIDFARDVTNAIEGELKNVDALIIDLRGNPGGGVGGLRLMSYLTADRLPIGYSVDRRLAEAGYDKESLPRFNRIPKSKWEAPLLALRYARKKSVVLETEGLGPQCFHGRVAILINEHTTCAAEMVALFAQERGLATIVGMPTPGRLVSHRGFSVGHGFTLVVPIGAYASWRGNRLDGSGIRPDISEDWSRDAVLKRGDSQLKAARHALTGTLSAARNA
jgi:carboxyl-terminal processing protease